MLFDFATITAREQYKLLVSTIAPRPIAWVVSQDQDGHRNAAPFSFVNALSGIPPVVGIGIGSRDPGRPKDTRADIRETGELVVNLVSQEAADSMNITAIEFEKGVDELEETQLEMIPSVYVKPPRIAVSPVPMECKLVQSIELGPESHLVLGRVVAMHVHDDMIPDAAQASHQYS
jgi:flavin reductase (DIM6/NTAB) family NADH-FMN oxidoreductase RutF